MTLYTGSDLATGIAYLVMVGCLLWAVRRIESGGNPLPSRWILAAAGLLLASAGLTHLLAAAWSVREPEAWAPSVARLTAAALACGIAVVLPYVLPRIVEHVRAGRAASASHVRDERIRRGLLGGLLGDWQWISDQPRMRWSPVLRALLGTPDGVDPTLERFLGCVHPDDRARVESELKRARAEAGDYAFDFRVRWPDGSTRWLEARGQFWRDGDEAAHLSGFFWDQSPRVEISSINEHQLAMETARKEEAERANREKDQFLALLSHELRTPLHAATTWLNIAARQTDASPEIHRVHTALRRAMASLSRLVEDLLDSSRIVSGKFSLERVPTLLSGALESTTNALEAVAAEKGVTLVVEDTASDVVVDGDPRRLAQALRALVDNAIKYTDAGSRVVISTRRVGDMVEVAVSDEGIGISKEALPWLFERFSQADSSRSRSHGGLGLGLFLVESIIAGHGGEVVAESDGPGRGATFRVRIPISPAPERAEEPVEPPSANAPARLHGLRILLVEDDELAAEALEEILTEYGAEVTLAVSARAARRAFREAPCDLILSDIGLPDEDGISLIGALRDFEEEADRRRVPAVAMSGYTASSDVAEMRAAGFDTHVAKPIEDFAAFQALLAQLGRSGAT